MAAVLPGFKTLPLPIIQLSLAAVLKCGQSFRWSIVPVKDDTEYRLCLRDRVVCLRQNQTTLFYRALYPDPQPAPTQLEIKDAETLCWLRDYFQLEVDLADLYKDWANRDPVFAKMQSRFEGIRILRQDPWENLVSFICSSNNNISRIAKMVQNLCTHYSPQLLMHHEDGTAYHPFPPPSALAQPSVTAALRSLGFGYRADFIQCTAKMLVDEHSGSPDAPEVWLAGLRKKTTDEAREQLLKLKGVGRKVADCILLMSLDKKEVIPVDTHVYQIAAKHYGVKVAGAVSGKKVNMTPKIYDEVNNKLSRVWGDYAGWAHSVLFTADLKSFASYNLANPGTLELPSPIKGGALPTPPLTPSPSPSKRSRRVVETETTIVTANTEDASITLAERVKRRRRAL